MKNIIRIDGKEIELSEETVDNFKRELGVVPIKGNNYLKSNSRSELNLEYNSINKKIYTYPVRYKLTKIKDLNVGDVICNNLTTNESELEVSDFEIYLGKEKGGNFYFQYLGVISGIEQINSMDRVNEEIEVIVFLRE